MRQARSKLWFCGLFTTILAGCGAPGIPLPPSLDLPQPVTDLRAVRKGDRVYLAWTIPTQTTDRQNVRDPGPTQICRSRGIAMNECGTPIGIVQPSPLRLPSSTKEKDKDKDKTRKAAAKPQAGWVDNLPGQLQQQDPAAQITYAVSVLNQGGRSAGLSNQVHVSAIPAVPPPPGFHAEVTAAGVRISLMCLSRSAMSAPEFEDRLRVYRRTEGSTTDSKVGEVNFRDCSSLEWVDQTFDWEKTYYYRADVATIISVPGRPQVEVEGDDTPEAKVFTHDVFPPAVPTGLQAVFSGTGQAPFVDLIWAPDTDPDLTGYNIYRHEQSNNPAKINSELVTTPAFRDASVVSGRKYFYSISAVDLRGNESARSEEASEAIP